MKGRYTTGFFITRRLPTLDPKGDPMKAKAVFLSFAVLVPLHVARAAMRMSVSMLSTRDRLQGYDAAAVPAPSTPPVYTEAEA